MTVDRSGVKIEKDIPIPMTWSDVVAKMSIADSFFIEHEKPLGGTKSNIINAGRRQNMKIISHKVEGGTRFWRVK